MKLGNSIIDEVNVLPAKNRGFPRSSVWASSESTRGQDGIFLSLCFIVSYHDYATRVWLINLSLAPIYIDKNGFPWKEKEEEKEILWSKW